MMETNQPNRLAAWLETAWLERYLDRQLSAEEVAWFETYAIDKPDLLEKIDADSDLRDAMHSEKAVDDGITVHGNVSLLHPKGSKRRFGRSSGLALLGLAASCLLGVGISRMLGSDEHGQSLIVSPDRIFVDLMRDADTSKRDKEILSDEGKQSDYVQIEAALPAGSERAVLSIEDQHNQILTRDLTLTPEDGVAMLNFIADRRFLQAAKSVRVDYYLGSVKKTKRISMTVTRKDR